MSDFFLDWHLDDSNPQVVYIMRGVPGSGKSFEALLLAAAEQIFSSDGFFGTTKEEYIANWKAEKLGAAHNFCQKNVRMAMQRRLTPIVVDNTNVVCRDIMPYIEMALRYGYRAELKEPSSEWWQTLVVPYLGKFVAYPDELEVAAKTLFEKCQHGVPLVTIRKMLIRWHVNVSAADMMKSILRRK
jgi:hypothetical protein